MINNHCISNVNLVIMRAMVNTLAHDKHPDDRNDKNARGGAFFGQVGNIAYDYKKHRKNCKCCPVSQLIVRSQRLS